MLYPSSDITTFSITKKYSPYSTTFSITKNYSPYSSPLRNVILFAVCPKDTRLFTNPPVSCTLVHKVSTISCVRIGHPLPLLLGTTMSLPVLSKPLCLSTCLKILNFRFMMLYISQNVLFCHPVPVNQLSQGVFKIIESSRANPEISCTPSSVKDGTSPMSRKQAGRWHTFSVNIP